MGCEFLKFMNGLALMVDISRMEPVPAKFLKHAKSLVHIDIQCMYSEILIRILLKEGDKTSMGGNHMGRITYHLSSLKVVLHHIFLT